MLGQFMPIRNTTTKIGNDAFTYLLLHGDARYTADFTPPTSAYG